MSKRSERRAARIQSRPTTPEGQEVERKVNRRLNISRSFQLGLAAVGLAFGITAGAELTTSIETPAIVHDIGDHIPGEGIADVGLLAFAVAGPVERRFARRSCERKILGFAEVRKQQKQATTDILLSRTRVDTSGFRDRATVTPGDSSFSRIHFAEAINIIPPLAYGAGSYMVSRALSGNMVPSPEYANGAGKTISPEAAYGLMGGLALATGIAVTIADQMHVSEQRRVYTTQIADIDSGIQPNPTFH